MNKDQLSDITATIGAAISASVVSAIKEHGNDVPDDAKASVLMNAVAMVVGSYFKGNLDEFFEVALVLEGWDDDKALDS